MIYFGGEFHVRPDFLNQRHNKAEAASRRLKKIHQAEEKYGRQIRTLHPAMRLEYSCYDKYGKVRDFVQIIPTFKPEKKEAFKKSIFVIARRWESPRSLIRRSVETAERLAEAFSRQGVLVAASEINKDENISR